MQPRSSKKTAFRIGAEGSGFVRASAIGEITSRWRRHLLEAANGRARSDARFGCGQA
ncbi:hypothetical protein P4K96_00965 [Bacillus cereus]|uniref:hypothetical protein n=1 Tax=Paenibacillus TaxID=44249 RepID=UPI001BCE5884|nr:hypothetical protein [Paenibacillus dendritiformis]MEB9892178.1 hypothetical protein [Bacillus cereus]